MKIGDIVKVKQSISGEFIGEIGVIVDTRLNIYYEQLIEVRFNSTSTVFFPSELDLLSKTVQYVKFTDVFSNNHIREEFIRHTEEWSTDALEFVTKEHITTFVDKLHDKYIAILDHLEDTDNEDTEEYAKNVRYVNQCEAIIRKLQGFENDLLFKL